MKSKKSDKIFDNYFLKGKFKKSGFQKNRYVFSGISKQTGEQKVFFVELYLVNPLLSPENPIIARKSNTKVSSQEIQQALLSESISTLGLEKSVIPSYVLIKAGTFGKNSKQFNYFSASQNCKFSKQQKSITVENFNFCVSSLKGEIAVTKEDLSNSPELDCSSGTIKWDLNFEKESESKFLCQNKTNYWIPSGAKTLFSGNVILDGEVFTIFPRTSNGFVDKSWGSKLASPYFHLSSSNFISSISGKNLNNSYFAVEGEFDSRLSVFVNIEGMKLSLSGKSFFKKFNEIHSWTQVPSGKEEEKLHWSVSVNRKKFVIDIDVFCKTHDMFVRNYENPLGNKEILKVLAGGNAIGEIRVYKKNKKTLEIVEHINLINVLCEYGSLDKFCD